MGLILIVIGAVAGWRSGAFRGFDYAVFGVIAAGAAALSLYAEARGSTALLLDPASLLLTWLFAFAEIAGAYTLLALLKAKRIENRGE